MCLILFAYQSHPDYPLIVAANRDEHYDRPTQPSEFWPDYPEVFAGRDLQAGGTWMGISIRGRFAAVTNYREGAPATGFARSRGELCSGFLTTQQSVDEYLQQLRSMRGEYAGFNLLLGDFSNLQQPQLGYYSNRLESPNTSLAAGIYGISNGLLNSEWPKVVGGRQALTQALDSPAETIMQILLDAETAPHSQLPSTGIDQWLEEQLSSRFISIDNYGTRSATVLRLGSDGCLEWTEQSFGHGGVPLAMNGKKIQLEITN